jgi:hypothetical protein
MGLDTKTHWLTDRQSQCDFDFEVTSVVTKSVVTEVCEKKTDEESQLLRSVTGMRLVKTDWKDLAYNIVICKVWKLAVVL